MSECKIQLVFYFPISIVIISKVHFFFFEKLLAPNFRIFWWWCHHYYYYYLFKKNVLMGEKIHPFIKLIQEKNKKIGGLVVHNCNLD